MKIEIDGKVIEAYSKHVGRKKLSCLIKKRPRRNYSDGVTNKFVIERDYRLKMCSVSEAIAL